MSLQNIQSEMLDLILHEELADDFKSQNPYFNIYRNNIRSNLENTLRAIYPLVFNIVGPDFFRLSILNYIKHYPSRSSNLHDYGEYFSDFLSEYMPAKDLIYLSEVASFEWIHHVLFFAADHPGLDLTFLEKVSPDQYGALHFTLNPACFLKKFRYPILRIISLCKNEIDTCVNLDEGGVDLLIIRRDLNIILTPLSPADFVFLKAIADNHSLTQALQAATFIEEAFDLTEKLSYFIRDKTIVDCFLE